MRNEKIGIPLKILLKSFEYSSLFRKHNQTCYNVYTDPMYTDFIVFHQRTLNESGENEQQG